MLRINLQFLSYIEALYDGPASKDIILRNYSKGSRLLEQNEASNKVFVIKEGFVKCFNSEQNGKDFIFEFLGKGEIIGEVEALRHMKCICNVEALSDVQVYALPTSFFASLCDRDRQFSHLLLTELAERLANTSSRASYQQLYTVKYALSKLFHLQERQNIKLSKMDMASYLGIDVRSLNRVLKELAT